MPIISASRRLRQEEHEFKARLGGLHSQTLSETQIEIGGGSTWSGRSYKT